MTIRTHIIGQSFTSAPRAETADLLEAATKAHRYIERFRVSGPDGCYWVDTPDAEPDLGFENGAAGIAYFYLALFESTNNSDYGRLSSEGFRYIRRHWRKQLRIRHPYANQHFELNVNSGIGSIASALITHYEATKEAASLAVLREIADYFADAAERNKGDVRWTGLPYYALGDSGIALLLLRMAIALNDESLRSLAIASAKTIVNSQTASPRGGKSWDVKPDGYPYSFPNFVIGTAGIGYAMSVFYDYTQDEAFLFSAKSAADYLHALIVPLDEGALVPLMDDPQDRTFYLGACHGAAGTSKLIYQLYIMTGESRYKRTIEEMSQGILGLGAPEVQSSGYWNNTCVCCGTAAILQLYIAWYMVFGNRQYLDVAIRCAQVLLGEAEEVGNGAIAWPLAETRLEPDTITLNKGYMHGSAGIANTLLQLYQVLNGSVHWHRLMDDPYPEHFEPNRTRGDSNEPAH